MNILNKDMQYRVNFHMVKIKLKPNVADVCEFCQRLLNSRSVFIDLSECTVYNIKINIILIH